MKKLFVLLLTAALLLTAFSGCDSQPAGTTEPVSEGPQPIEIAKHAYVNPINGFDAEGNIAYGGDPSVLVDGDTVYLYVGHDTATAEAYVIPEYLCYSTTDLLTWNYEGVVLSMKDVTWADKNSAWAGQVAKHYDTAAGKDMYYFYFCSWDKTDSGKQSIGVAVSESPTGPFVDLGTALVKGSFTTDETSAWNDIDPTVWIETDENGVEHRYLGWGNSKLYTCELNEDMISVKDYNGDGEITFGKDIKSKMLPTSFTEAAWFYRRQDESGKFYGDYYLFYAYGWREQLAFATTHDLMEGKWSYGDVIMKPSVTSNTNHPAVFDFKGETYMIYHTGALAKGSGFRRSAAIAKLKFYSDGFVAYVDETAIAVTGTASTLTALNGEQLGHEWFNNSATDDAYPYTGKALGSNLDKTKPADYQWVLVEGKADVTNGTYVSIQSNNKPGLYITCGEGTAVLSQDADGMQGQKQTFITVSGLAGEGVSFESLAFPGMYLTLSGGTASLTDGSDANAATFTIADAE